jgi:hypothetical protein
MLNEWYATHTISPVISIRFFEQKECANLPTINNKDEIIVIDKIQNNIMVKKTKDIKVIKTQQYKTKKVRKKKFITKQWVRKQTEDSELYTEVKEVFLDEIKPVESYPKIVGTFCRKPTEPLKSCYDLYNSWMYDSNEPWMKKYYEHHCTGLSRNVSVEMMFEEKPFILEKVHEIEFYQHQTKENVILKKTIYEMKEQLGNNEVIINEQKKIISSLENQKQKYKEKLNECVSNKFQLECLMRAIINDNRYVPQRFPDDRLIISKIDQIIHNFYLWTDDGITQYRHSNEQLHKCLLRSSLKNAIINPLYDQQVWNLINDYLSVPKWYPLDIYYKYKVEPSCKELSVNIEQNEFRQPTILERVYELQEMPVFINYIFCKTKEDFQKFKKEKLILQCGTSFTAWKQGVKFNHRMKSQEMDEYEILCYFDNIFDLKFFQRKLV